MSKISLVVVDSDQAYMEGLVTFLIQKYSHVFNISSFTSHVCLSKFLSQNDDHVDILLINPKLYINSIDSECIKCLVFMHDGKTSMDDKTVTYVNKYQCGDKLVGCILNTYAQKNSVSFINNKNATTKIIGVFSPQGGVGKTCITVSLCIHCAKRGMKVFYLNLEDFCSTGSFFECSEHCDFASIVYYLKERSKDIALKIEASKCVDATWGIHYFLPWENSTEVNELSRDDVRVLVEHIKGMGSYDAVFVDMTSSLNSRNTGIFEVSDKVLLLVSDQLTCKQKLQKFMQDLDMLEHRDESDIRNKMDLIINKYNSANSNGTNFQYLFGKDVAMRIPEIKEFDKSKILNLAKMDSSYTVCMEGLIKQYFPKFSKYLCEEKV